MKLDFFKTFSDPYLQKSGGQGAFLAGVSLGMIVQGQAKDNAIDSTPLYKQLNFGRLKLRDLKRHLSRVPELLKVYEMKYKESDISKMIQDLVGKSGELLLLDEGYELSVEGNFAFTTGFINANEYFWRIFAKKSDN